MSGSLCEIFIESYPETKDERCSPVITHGLGEWKDIIPGAGTERCIHQHINIHHRRLLEVEAVIERRRRVHSFS